MRPRSLALLFAVAVAGPSSARAAELRCPETYPLQHQAVTLTVLGDAGAPVAGAEVVARYRPGSDVERAEPVGRTGADGTVSWTPDIAGLVTLDASWSDENGSQAASLTLSVRFDGVPASGVAVFLLAGVILFGGAGWSISRLLRDDRS